MTLAEQLTRLALGSAVYGPPLQHTEQEMQPAPERKRNPSLFEKVTQRFTQSPPKPAQPQYPAQQAQPAQQARPQADRRPEPARQPQLELDPADRMSISRSEEDTLDIPAFLRRQAN